MWVYSYYKVRLCYSKVILSFFLGDLNTGNVRPISYIKKTSWLKDRLLKTLLNYVQINIKRGEGEGGSIAY